MSWLSELTWSNTDERIMQMVAGNEELDESVVSTYDRKQGFLYKIAQKIAELSEGGGGGGAVYATFTEDNGTWSCDKTFAELKAAYDDGAAVIAVVYTHIQYPVTFPLVYIEAGEDTYAFYGICTDLYDTYNDGVHFEKITAGVLDGLVQVLVDETICVIASP